MKITHDFSFKKDLNNAIKKIEKAAQAAAQDTMQARKNKFASFDETEVVPYSSGPTGQITFSGSRLSRDDMSLEAILAKETDELTEKAMWEFTKSVKGVFE